MAEFSVPIQAFPSLSPPSGASVDTFQLPSGAVRQAMVIADPDSAIGIASVDPVLGLSVSVQSILPATSGTSGLETYNNPNFNNTPIQVKGVSGNVFGMHFYNPNSTDVFLHFYDALIVNVIVGTTPPKLTYWIPAFGSLDWPVTTIGIPYETAIATAATATLSGSGALANGILANVLYA